MINVESQYHRLIDGVSKVKQDIGMGRVGMPYVHVVMESKDAK